MRILVIQCFDAPGGQSNRSYLFAEELSKIGHNVTYFTNRYNHLDNPKDTRTELNQNNTIKHLFAENKSFKNSKILSVIFNSLKLLIILKREEFNIIIGPSVPLINSFIALLIKNKKTKFIFEIRDVWPAALIYNSKISKLNPIYFILKIFEIIIYKKSDGLISALPKTFDYINRYNKNLPQLYLPNSYQSYLRYDKKFNKDKIKIIYIGRFNSSHDIEIILRSARYLLHEKKIKNILFDIYGYGDQLEYIKKYKSKFNLENLNLNKQVNKNDIYSTLKKYDLALCTLSNSKIYQWGTNLNKIYEYFNSGIPVIFSGKVPNNPVEEANCGLICYNYDYIDFSNKIITFSKLSNDKKKKFSVNAKNFFENNYNLNNQTKKLDKFLNLYFSQKNC